MLPENCTIDEATEAVREWHAHEEHRLWESYPPLDPDDYDDEDTDVPSMPPAPEPEPYEASDSDRQWLAPQSIADELQDWQDFSDWADHFADLPPAGCYADADLAAAGLAIG